MSRTQEGLTMLDGEAKRACDEEFDLRLEREELVNLIG